ncbi:MAG TPA: hypothetical protein VJJ76_02030 [archaeon]|nr:hypothetical protein [archaeon]
MEARQASIEKKLFEIHRLQYQRKVDDVKAEFSRLTRQDLYALREALVLESHDFKEIAGHTSMGSLEIFAKMSPEEAAKYHNCIATIYRFRSKHSYAFLFDTDASLDAVISLLSENPDTQNAKEYQGKVSRKP